MSNDRTKRIPVAVNDNDIERLRMDAEERGLPLSDHVRDRLNLPEVKRGRKPGQPRPRRKEGEK